MMERITSVFDWYRKAETDERYKRLAVLAYKDGMYPAPPECDLTYPKAKAWIDQWIKTTVSPYSLNYPTCQAMVDFANARIYLIDRENN